VSDNDLINLTADIVSAHVANNNVPAAELPGLIQTVYAALEKTSRPAETETPKAQPAVSIRASVRNDYIVCLEDGKKLKMLKRYLRTNYNMTPEEYRAKWGLPRDYPMVAPAYAEQRKDLAKKIGLGRKRPESAVKPPKATKATKVPSGVEALKKARGRPAKAKALPAPAQA